MMNIVESSGNFQIYGDEIRTHKNLPVDTFDVCFNKMTGFYLSKRDNMKIKEEKIYGCSEKKVNKILNSFNLTDRNMGVILSGSKGIGKTLFAKMLSKEAISRGIPMLIVGAAFPGISDFLSSIEQEAVVLFDEYEKTFKKNDDYDPQEQMLSLFDGIDNGKKMYVITCNEVGRLNEYFINRPGRFHYHIRLQKPSEDEIREYLNDKLLPEYKCFIDKIASLASISEITYDSLRALSFEINQGISFEECLEDLNIGLSERNFFDIFVKTKNGILFTSMNRSINLSGSDEFDAWLDCNDKKYNNNFRISFNPINIVLIDGVFTIPIDLVDKYIDSDIWKENARDQLAGETDEEYDVYYSNLEKEESDNLTIESIRFVKSMSPNNKNLYSRFI